MFYRAVSQISLKMTLSMCRISVLQLFFFLSFCSFLLLCLTSHLFHRGRMCQLIWVLLLQENNQYLSSSIIAAFLDTMSLIYRSRTSPLPVAHIVDVLTFGGRKVRVKKSWHFDCSFCVCEKGFNDCRITL